MSKIEVKPVSRKSDLVTQEHEKEILIYDLIINKAFSLNETSALIWQLCNGKNSVSEIAAELSRKMKSPISEDFVWLALEQLKNDNLLANANEIPVDFNGLSRRDVIRKVGFTTLAALPLIASLSAPKAAFGASLAANGTPCTANGQCASTCCGATAAGAANQSCVAMGLESTGSFCRAGCECASICCVSNTCQPGNIPAGSGCVTACQCASKSCNTNTGLCNAVAP